jgi:hypothetical protein
MSKGFFRFKGLLKGASFGLSLALSGAMAPAAQATEFELRTGFDVFSRSQSLIEGQHYVSLMHSIGHGFSFGETLYSAALGDAGGVFIGGFELSHRTLISERLSFDLSGFIGGGGGAGQVPGDGLMLRAGAGLGYALSERTRLTGGISYVRLLGSTVNTPALSFGLTRRFGLNVSAGHTADRGFDMSGTSVRALKPTLRAFFVGNSTNRSGGALGTMYLAGAEVSFGQGHGNEYFISADGALAGDGEGYMQVLGGYRGRFGGDSFGFFADAALGFGGGGDVDTGGGLIAAVGGGVSARISRGMDVELGVNAIRAAQGDFQALSPYLRTSFVFGRRGQSATDIATQRWNFSTGVSMQIANSTFRNIGNTNTANPVLHTAALDFFMSDRIYLTGEAQTVMLGDAGGYAIGLMGAGYAFALSDRFTLSVEGLLGAAGGGGVRTNGGLVGAGRIELDYEFSPRASATFGVGMVRALRGTGMAPVTVNIGLKFPFTTYH